MPAGGSDGESAAATGPLFLVAAVYVVLWGFHLVPMQLGIFLDTILGITVLAYLAEIPLGKYRKSVCAGQGGSVHE